MPLGESARIRGTTGLIPGSTRRGTRSLEGGARGPDEGVSFRFLCGVGEACSSRSVVVDAVVCCGGQDRAGGSLGCREVSWVGRVRHAWTATTSAIAVTTLPKTSNVDCREMCVTRIPARTAGTDSDP